MNLKSEIKKIYYITQKESTAHIKSKRIIILVLIFGMTIVAGAYISSTAFMYFLKMSVSPLEPSTIEILSLSYLLSAFLMPLIAITLSYDAINGEISQGTMELLLSKPISKISILLGKFLGVVGTIGITYFTVSIASYIVILQIAGVSFDIGELKFVIDSIIASIFYTAIYVAWGLLFSTIFKNTTTALIFAIFTWIGLTMLGIVNYMLSTLYNSSWYSPLFSAISPNTYFTSIDIINGTTTLFNLKIFGAFVYALALLSISFKLFKR